jgi:hypothetical protein
MLRCLAATTQISQQRGMQPRELSGCRFVSNNRPARHLYQQSNSTSLETSFSLLKAIPQFAAAIEKQIDCDDASNDFIKEKLHSNIRSSSTDSMTRPSYSSIDVSPQRPCGFMDDNRGSFADMSLKIKRVSPREPCGTSGRATTAYSGPGKAREPVWWAGVDHGDNPEPGCG